MRHAGILPPPKRKNKMEAAAAARSRSALGAQGSIGKGASLVGEFPSSRAIGCRRRVSFRHRRSESGPCCWLRAAELARYVARRAAAWAAAGTSEILVFWKATTCQLDCSFTTIKVGRVSISRASLPSWN